MKKLSGSKNKVFFCSNFISACAVFHPLSEVIEDPYHNPSLTGNALMQNTIN